MLNWLFGKSDRVSESDKDYSRLIPRIASTIDGILRFKPEYLMKPYSTFILNDKYGVSWTGGSEPHQLQEGEIAFAQAYECKNFEDFKEALQLASQTHGPAGGHLIHMTVDTFSTEIGSLLIARSGRNDINL